jgi:hypothetical protein
VIVGGEHVVHAARELLVEARRDLGVRRVGQVEQHTPLTRLDAPSREMDAYRPSGETVTSLIVRASTRIESVLTMLFRSVMSKISA